MTMLRIWLLMLIVLSLGLWKSTAGYFEAPDHWTRSGVTKEMVASQISNKRCFSSDEYLESCREAVRTAKEQIGRDDLHWPDDDFDSIPLLVEKLPQRIKASIMEKMLNAHLKVFDPHAFIMSSSAFDRMLVPGAERRDGVGIRYIVTDAGVFVRKVLPNSPASVAGLKAFDRIVRINGVEVRNGLEASKNMGLLSGVKGDTITVGVETNGQYHDAKLRIALVEFPEIESDLIDFRGRKYAYIWFSRFKGGSCHLLDERLRKLLPQAEGLILDLRDNDGGLLDQAVCIAALFVGRERVVGEKFVSLKIPMDVIDYGESSSQIRWQSGTQDGIVNDLPVVALVNANSASGTEILVGALQDHKKAWLVGERTFGKGSVQRVKEPIGHPSFKVAFTSAFYYRPSGATTQLVGVKPDFEVPIRRSASEAERRFLHEHDFYPTSPPVKPLKLRQVMRREPHTLRRCVEDLHLDLSAEQLLQQRGPEDYQEAYALAVLDCQLTRAFVRH